MVLSNTSSRSQLLLFSLTGVLLLGQTQPPLLPMETYETARREAAEEERRPQPITTPPGEAQRFKYSGGLAPDGFRLVEQPRWSLVATGIVVAATGHLSTIINATLMPMPARELVLIPIVGPVVSLMQLALYSRGLFAFLDVGFYAVIVIVQLIAQVGGATLAIVGGVKKLRWLELAPVATADGAGLSAYGRF